MKQGRASTSSVVSNKREPTAHAVNIGEVAEMGLQYHDYDSEELYKGRGFEAPMVGTTTHHCGSQGKHK